MKNKVIILSLVFLVLVIMLAPARMVQNLLPTSSPLILENMTGTIWSGKLERANAEGWFVEDVDYQISFLPLLTATVSGSLEIAKGDVTGSFEFSASDQNNLAIEQASLFMSADKLVNFIPFPGIEFTGELSTENLSIEVEDKKIVFISGVTSWKESSITLNNQRQELGEFTIDWSTNDSDKTILGKLRKTKNQVGLEGGITLDSNGVAEFKGSISNTADRNLYTTLSLFADGKVELGRLPIKFKKKIQ